MDSATSAGLTAVLLIGLLVGKQLSAAYLRRKWRRLAFYLNIAVVPLLVIFFINIAVEFYSLLP